MPRFRRITSYAAASAVALGAAISFARPEPIWPSTTAGPPPSRSAPTTTADRDDELVAARGVCVGSRVWSAGTLGDTVLYRHRREGNRLYVGYFVYWSTERPWGQNGLTLAVAPALAIDAVYSHLLFVLPGAREAMYGPGDVEGAMVAYEERPDGTLAPIFGAADDEHHQRVELAAGELADASGRPVLVTDVWSHQLGGHGAVAQRSDRSTRLRCFGPGELRPMTGEIAARFHLGDEGAPMRARPAWRLN